MQTEGEQHVLKYSQVFHLMPANNSFVVTNGTDAHVVHLAFLRNMCVVVLPLQPICNLMPSMLLCTSLQVPSLLASICVVHCNVVTTRLMTWYCFWGADIFRLN